MSVCISIPKYSNYFPQIRYKGILTGPVQIHEEGFWNQSFWPKTSNEIGLILLYVNCASDFDEILGKNSPLGYLQNGVKHTSLNMLVGML